MKTVKVRKSLPALSIQAIAALAATIALSPAISSAADEPANTARNNQLEEIIVTATRRETSVQDVKYNLSAVSGEQLEDLRIIDTTELARWTPGLTVVDQGPRQSNLTIMRGTNINNVTSSDFNFNTNGGSVATYYGETPIYIDPLLVDMQRVEILRGPQGTVFGSSSIGGALRYLPVKPNSSEFQTDIHLRGATVDQSDDLSYQGDLTFNAPIIKDVLAFRASIARVENAGFIDYNFVMKQPGVSNPEDPADLKQVEDANSEEVTLLRAALLWNITDNIESVLTYTKQSRNVGGRQVNNKESFGTGEYEAAYRYEEPNKRDHDILQLDFNFDFGFATLVSATSYSEYRENGQRDQTDLNYFEFPPIDLADIDNFPAFSAFARETVTTDRLTQEFRLVSSGDSRLSWLAGVFYQDFDETINTQETSPGLADYANSLAPPYGLLNDIVYDNTGVNKLKETALFGQVGYYFTDKWQATFGGRWFDIENTLTNSTSFPYADPTVDTTTGDASGKDSIYMFNTSYEFSGAALGYVTISEGYSLGGTNPFPVCADANSQCILEEESLVEPEKVRNYELGARTSWLDQRLQLNGAVYQMDYKNIQIFAPSQLSGLFINKNGPKSRSRGIELELTATLGEFWWTGAGYSYNKSELREDSDELYFETVRKGDALPGTPKNQLSWYLANRYPMQNGLDFLFRYGFNFTDDVYTKIADGDTCCREDGEILDAFFVHNASIGLAGEKWEATLYGDNLTNENAYTGVRLDRSFIQTDPFSGLQDRRYYKNIITPRSIGVDFRYRW